MSIYQNQRANTRTHIAGKVKYSRSQFGETFDARLHDCSENGLGIISKFPYLPNTELLISSRDPNDTNMQKANVAWSKQVRTPKKSEPVYRIGVKFV